jgi:hypothetical protein
MEEKALLLDLVVFAIAIAFAFDLVVIAIATAMVTSSNIGIEYRRNNFASFLCRLIFYHSNFDLLINFNQHVSSKT